MLGKAVAVKSFMLAWQLEQLPVAGCAVSLTKKVPAAFCGRVWKPLNGAVVVMGYWPMPIHTILVSWQVVQVPVVPAWIMVAVGVGARKPLPGAVLVATPGTSTEGVLPRWQLSQVLVVGRCEPTPGVVDGGITTILVTPKKVLPVTFCPWQVAQPVVIPLWLNLPPAKVVMAPLAPASGISVLGILPVWQVSQPMEPDTGMCAGVRLAMVLGVTPKKVPAITLAPWQVEHPVVTPTWL